MKVYVIDPPAEQGVMAAALQAVGLASPVEVVDLPEATMMDEIKALLGADEVEGERIYEFGDYVFRAKGDAGGKVVVVGKNQHGEWVKPEAGEEDMVKMLREKT